jgi:hypothetical protein
VFSFCFNWYGKSTLEGARCYFIQVHYLGGQENGRFAKATPLVLDVLFLCAGKTIALFLGIRARDDIESMPKLINRAGCLCEQFGFLLPRGRVIFWKMLGR